MTEVGGDEIGGILRLWLNAGAATPCIERPDGYTMTYAEAFSLLLGVNEDAMWDMYRGWKETPPELVAKLRLITGPYGRTFMALKVQQLGLGKIIG